MPKCLTAVAGVVVLAMLIVARTTLAWSATTCPTKLMSPNTSPLSTSNCGEEHLEEDEERVEEELEEREDEEEERAIAAERAARTATDATEEAAEEAQEQTGPEKTTSVPASAQATLKLRVRVLTLRDHSPLHPDETRISVATSVPSHIRVALQAHGGPVKLFRGESIKGRKYVLPVPWTCHTRARRYTFTVTAHRESGSQISGDDVTMRRRAFTIDTHTICSKNRPDT
jgi:hypothetical protein